MLGINSGFDELLDTLYDVGFVLLVSYAEPLGIAVEHLQGHLIFVNQCVHAQGDEELSLRIGHICGIGKKLFEENLGLSEEIGCESEKVHRYDSILRQLVQAVSFLIDNLAVRHPLYGSTFHDRGEITLRIDRALAA